MEEKINHPGYMTVKQLAETAGVSTETIRRWINRLYPDSMKPQQTTYLAMEACIKILENVRKKNMVSFVPQNVAGGEQMLPQIEAVEKPKPMIFSVDTNVKGSKVFKSSKKQEKLDRIIEILQKHEKGVVVVLV